MWLKKLTLKNFQKHADLTLDFTPGVNIIYGHSDAGKSCIRRAIGFVFFGDPRTDDVIRKEGTKTTSVSVLLDNGTEVERVKSASINRYVIRVPGHKELTFDSIGAEIPEEVQQVLQTKLVEVDKLSLNLNVAEQVCLPFLSGADFPASARLKLFNKLTGNDVIDAVQQNINKEIINIRRNVTVQENIVKTNEPEIVKLDAQISKKLCTIQQIKERKEAVEAKYQTLLKLIALDTKAQAIKMGLEETTAALGALKQADATRITPLKEHCARLQQIKALKASIETCKISLQTAKAALEGVKAPETNGEAIKAKISRYEALTGLLANLAVQETRRKDAQGDLDKISSVLPTQEAEYKKILKEAGICPTCKAVITEEHIAHVKI